MFHKIVLVENELFFVQSAYIHIRLVLMILLEIVLLYVVAESNIQRSLLEIVLLEIV